jgi:uncharacterized DUF497 family protein
MIFYVIEISFKTKIYVISMRPAPQNETDFYDQDFGG